MELDATDAEGNTALHLAIQHGHRTLAILLVQHGASLAALNHAQHRPCDLTDSTELQYELKTVAGECRP